MAVPAAAQDAAGPAPVRAARARGTAARVAAVAGRDRLALLAALGAPPAAAAALASSRATLPAADAALILVVVVVAVAATGRRLAGVIAALSAAAWFDFFLTRPYESFDITSRANVETMVLLLVIGVAVTELAVWGRRQHAAASRRAGYLDGISAAAAAMAGGGSPSGLIEEVSGQLARLLSMRSCVFQYGVAGLGGPARLRSDGQVVAARDGSPDAPVELLVENGGLLHGRFLMTPEPGARTEPEQRLIAVALAEQVGAALGARRPVIR
jgi:K+-sensing histidine kinase KdpD